MRHITLLTLAAALGLSASNSLLGCIQGKQFNDPILRPTKIDLSSRFPSHVQVKIPTGAIKERTPTPEETAEELSRKTIAEYEQKAPGTATVDEINDYAASLIYVKRPVNAIPVLVALEKKTPGLYATAANLGTAYELMGDLPNALKWIQEGVSRNVQSHRGTEWLHVAILVAKTKLQAEPDWLETHSILEAAAPRSAEETVRAIEYQLNERLHFVSPADAVVCDLFYQAALRLNDPAMQNRRKAYLEESLRFGDLRKSSIEGLGAHPGEERGRNEGKTS